MSSATAHSATDEPLVSVLIPLFNGEEVLAQTLESVGAQTYRNWQAIIVDDGSSDGSLGIARIFAEREARFEVLQQANAGTQAARNTALRHARGEYIALLDQDDVWLPEKLAAQIAIFRDDPRASLVFTNYHFWDGEMDMELRYVQREKLPKGDVSEGLARACLFGAASVLMPKATLDAVGPFDEELVHTGDWDMWLRIAEHASRHGGFHARGTWEPLMRYRMWAGNASKDSIRMAEGTVCVVEKCLARVQGNDSVSTQWRTWYEASLRHARAALALAQTRIRLDELDAVGDLKTRRGRREIGCGLWRAWQSEPKISYALWALACVWPPLLGGDLCARPVHRRLRRKW